MTMTQTVREKQGALNAAMKDQHDRHQRRKAQVLGFIADNALANGKGGAQPVTPSNPIGRNDICPCLKNVTSDHPVKYKRCCLRSHRVAAAGSSRK